MYECSQAIYHDELFSADDLKRADGDYNQELRLSMKKESQSHEFFCPECGENLILCAGNIREPYFRHYDGSECVLNERDTAERYYAMLSCMEELAVKSYKDCKVTHYGSIAEHMRSQLLIETSDAVYALNYVSNSVNLKWLQNKMEKLNECGVVPIWFTVEKDNIRQTPTTVEYAISKTQSILKTIFPKQRLIKLKEYDDNGNRLLLCETYHLEDMFLDETGEFICDFLIRKKRVLDVIHEKELLGERLYQSFYEKICDTPLCTITDIEDAVLHINESADDIPQNAVYMSSREEFWVPKKIVGEQSLRIKALEYRNAFLYYCNERLLDNRKEHYVELSRVYQILDMYRQASDWV